MSTRKVVVDDTDEDIKYEGNWFIDAGTSDQAGYMGHTFLRTQHGTGKTGSSFSFAFKGTSVHVFGTSNLEYNTGGQPINPTWTCAVDKIQIPSGEPTRGVQNNWHLCDQPDMADGDHVLTVNVTTAGRTFWLDHIQYTPSNDVPLDAAVVKVDNLDPSIVFDTAWRAHSATNMTQTPGSKMTFNFTGKSLSWLGWVPSEFPRGISNATYSIDGGAPVTFRLNGLASNEVTKYNQVFFTTPELAPTPHTLEVIHQGTSAQTPLTLDFMYIVNASSSLAAPPPSTDTNVNGTPQSKGPAIGAIVGGAVGGVVVIALLILGFILLRRKRHRKAGPYHDKSEFDPVSPKGPEVTPFMATPFPQPAPSATDSHSQSQTGESHLYATNAVHQQVHLKYDRPVPGSDVGASGLSPSVSGWGSPSSLAGASSNLGSSTTSAVSRKRQEAEASVVHNQSTSSEVLLHQDSGIRLPAQKIAIEEVPPTYTPA